MTTAHVVKTSVTNNSLSKDYPHPEDHAKQIRKKSSLHTDSNYVCFVSSVMPTLAMCSRMALHPQAYVTV